MYIYIYNVYLFIYTDSYFTFHFYSRLSSWLMRPNCADGHSNISRWKNKSLLRQGFYTMCSAQNNFEMKQNRTLL